MIQLPDIVALMISFSIMTLLAGIWPLLFSCLLFAGVLIFCLYQVITALRRGYISYSGNRNTLNTKRYSRKEQPFLFWMGIIAFSLPALVLVVLGLLLIGGV